MKYLITMIVSLLMLFSCSWKSQPLEYYGPRNKTFIELVGGKAALIRTYYCDIIVENVRNKEWNRLSSYEMFRGSGSEYPREAAFHLIITNTWKKPLVIEKVELVYGNKRIQPEYFSEIKDKSFASSRYNINFENLWKSRRILTSKRLIENINFKNDSIGYDFDFIAPGDRISKFYLFDYIPIDRNEFKLSITIKYLKFKKVIDFDMKRFEYKESKELEENF